MIKWDLASLEPIAPTCYLLPMAHPAMQMTAVLTPSDDGGYIALNPETGTTTEGETVESAVGNLREAVELYLEEFPGQSFATPLVTTFTVAQHA
jgi:predicted RNase H-like HicB family nuclease